MTGIYKITNIINKKVYIGQSIDIEKRWGEHKRNAFNPNTHTYNYPLYRAIRKYGLTNFEFEVIEETDRQHLTTEEQYFINLYKALDPQYGYNLVPAIEPKRGENCNWAILTDKDTELVINLIINTDLTFEAIGAMFHVSSSCIEDINKGRRRHQDNLQYPLRKNAKSLAHRGEKQNTAILTTQDVLICRQRYVNEEIVDIYKDYANKMSFTGFKNMIFGRTWKHLPCYKKRLKQWVYPK